jgi:hypothetical protein
VWAPVNEWPRDGWSTPQRGLLHCVKHINRLGSNPVQLISCSGSQSVSFWTLPLTEVQSPPNLKLSKRPILENYLILKIKSFRTVSPFGVLCFSVSGKAARPLLQLYSAKETYVHCCCVAWPTFNIRGDKNAILRWHAIEKRPKGVYRPIRKIFAINKQFHHFRDIREQERAPLLVQKDTNEIFC